MQRLRFLVAMVVAFMAMSAGSAFAQNQGGGRGNFDRFAKPFTSLFPRMLSGNYAEGFEKQSSRLMWPV